MAVTPNKNYQLQVTGSNINTWGVVTNGILSTIDANLGGTLNKNVSGSGTVTLTPDEASELIHNLSGVLTGNITYLFPAQGGFYAVHNQTTGAFSVTVNVVGGTGGGIQVAQGTTTTIYIDASVPDVYGFTGTSSVYAAVAVAGSPNALTVAQTVPGGFSLAANPLILFTPISINTAAGPTLNVAGTGAFPIKGVTPSGLVNLPPGSLVTGSPIIAQFNGSAWIALNTLYEGRLIAQASNFTATLTSLWNCYYATAPFTATITQTTNLPYYWWIELNALSGAITITPNGSDSINSLAAGQSFTMPQGTSGKLETDAAGKLILNFNASNIGNPQLATMPTKTVKANVTGGTAIPTDATVSAVLDTISNARGSILYRGVSAWQALGVGGSTQYLGGGTDPSWKDFSAVTGTVLQIEESLDPTIVSTSSTILSNAAFTSSQGAEFTQGALAFTPISAASTLLVEVFGNFVISTTGSYPVKGVIGLFIDANSSAAQISATSGGIGGSSGGGYGQLYMSYKVASGSTSARTYKLRFGPVFTSATGSITFSMNGSSGSDSFGGTLKSGIRVTEIQS